LGFLVLSAWRLGVLNVTGLLLSYTAPRRVERGHRRGLIAASLGVAS
jgi:hypothetical protein